MPNVAILTLNLLFHPVGKDLDKLFLQLIDEGGFQKIMVDSKERKGGRQEVLRLMTPSTSGTLVNEDQAAELAIPVMNFLQVEVADQPDFLYRIKIALGMFY